MSDKIDYIKKQIESLQEASKKNMESLKMSEQNIYVIKGAIDAYLDVIKKIEAEAASESTDHPELEGAVGG